MNKYVVFLRGINVSGQKKMLMDDLKLLLKKNGFNDVTTYIQSGNIILNSSKNEKNTKENIEDAILNQYGFAVNSFISTPNKLKQILQNCPFLHEQNPKKIYFTLLENKPSDEQWEKLVNANYGSGKLSLWENIVYLYLPEGYSHSKLSTNFIEGKLKLSATARNLRTMQKMIDLSE